MDDTRWRRRWRILAWVTTAVVAASLVEATIVSTHHLGSEGWPAHAKFHALVGGLYLAVLAAVALVLAWGPLRHGDRWTRVALVLVLVAMPAVALVASLVIPDGAAPLRDRILAAVGVVAALGIGIASQR